MAAYERLFALWDNMPWEWSPDPMSIVATKVKVDLNQKRYHTAEVEGLLVKIEKIYEKEFGQDDPSLIFPLGMLAEYYSKQGMLALAVPLHERILNLRQKFLSHDSFDTSGELGKIVELHARQGQYEKAITIAKQQLKTYQGRLWPDSPFLSTPLLQLEELYSKNGQHDQARAVLERALGLCEKNIPRIPHEFCTNDPVDRLLKRAGEYSAARQYNKAEQLYRRALLARERKFGPDHMKSSQSMQIAQKLSTLYRATNKTTEADPLQ
jgi:tetratricopeptide (TPR) repeat protein